MGPKNKNLFILTLLFVFILAGCGFGSSTGGASGQPLQSQTFELPASGGEASLEALTVKLVPQAGGSAFTLSLQELNSGRPAEESSSLYQLQGLPEDFSGVLDITLTVPEALLAQASAGEADKGLILWVGQPVYAPSEGGWINTELPVEAEVDLASGEVSTHLEVPQSGFSYARKLSAPYLQQTYTTENALSYRVSYGWLHNTAESEHFSITYPKSISSVTMDQFVDAIEQDWTILSGELSFPMGAAIPVYIEELDYWQDGGLVSRDGYFGWNKSQFYRGVHLAYNTRLLLNELDTLKATVAHELMHWGQYQSYKSKGSEVIEAYTTLDEMTAMWFERRVLGKSWLPNIALSYVDMVSKPWFYASQSEAQDAGYWASWFASYMVDQEGVGFIQNAYIGSYQNSRTALIGSVLDSTNTTLDKLFREFLPSYFLFPDLFYPGLAASSEFRSMMVGNQAFLHVATSEGGDTVLEFYTTRGASSSLQEQTSFENRSGSFNTDTCALEEGLEPSLRISKTLDGMTGYLFTVSIFDKDSNPVCLDQPAVFEITVDSADVEAGVMVYAIPSDGSLANAVLLAGPDSYLAAGRNQSLKVSGVSQAGGEGQYEQLAILLFNSDDDESNNNAHPVSVEITYKLKGAVELEGEASATQFNYPTNVCESFPEGADCCVVVSSSCATGDNSGGYGGGEGDCPDCLVVPAWCESCSQYSDATTYLYIMREAGDKDRLNILIDAEGKIERIQFYGWFGNMGMPDSLSYNGSYVSARWNSVWGGMGSLDFSGSLNENGGSGTWVLSHPGPGTMISGVWNVYP